jgi:ankyrin repeat protein
LIKKGVLIDVQDENGDTPLYVAYKNKYFNIVKYLLSKESDIHVKNYNNNSLFDLILNEFPYIETDRNKVNNLCIINDIVMRLFLDNRMFKNYSHKCLLR